MKKGWRKQQCDYILECLKATNGHASKIALNDMPKCDG
jgi:hypothetical protein